MHHPGCHVDDYSTYWGAKADHCPSQRLQILLISVSSPIGDVNLPIVGTPKKKVSDHVSHVYGLD